MCFLMRKNIKRAKSKKSLDKKEKKKIVKEKRR
jgi:hypothetical protein